MKDKIIELQWALIEKLEARINKPKGFLDKLGQVLKEIILIGGGVLLGRAGI